MIKWKFDKTMTGKSNNFPNTIWLKWTERPSKFGIFSKSVRSTISFVRNKRNMKINAMGFVVVYRTERIGNYSGQNIHVRIIFGLQIYIRMKHIKLYRYIPLYVSNADRWNRMRHPRCAIVTAYNGYQFIANNNASQYYQQYWKLRQSYSKITYSLLSCKVPRFEIIFNSLLFSVFLNECNNTMKNRCTTTAIPIKQSEDAISY